MNDVQYRLNKRCSEVNAAGQEGPNCLICRRHSHAAVGKGLPTYGRLEPNTRFSSSDVRAAGSWRIFTSSAASVANRPDSALSVT